LSVTTAHPTDRVIWPPSPEPEETHMSEQNLAAESTVAIDFDNALAKA
jgi:hypothetical protein